MRVADNDLEVGKYVVTSLPVERELNERLSDLGFLEGGELEIISFSPFRGPAIVVVRGAEYAVRLSTLAKIGLSKK